MGLHPNHVIYGLFCRQEADLQIISSILSIFLTYTCAVLNAMKNNKTLQQFCGSLYKECCFRPYTSEFLLPLKYRSCLSSLLLTIISPLTAPTTMSRS